MKKFIVGIACLLFIFAQLNAQNPIIKRIDPTNWWVGMKNPALQLLIYGTNIKGSKVNINYQGVIFHADPPICGVNAFDNWILRV